MTDMSRMFSGAKAFNGNITDYDVSKVEDFRFMFNHAHSFSQPIGGWNVTTRNYELFFNRAYSFDADLSSWRPCSTPNTNMFRMFSDTHSFNSDLSSWRYVTPSSEAAFENAYKFRSDLSSWRAGTETRVEPFFQACSMEEHFLPENMDLVS